MLRGNRINYSDDVMATLWSALEMKPVERSSLLSFCFWAVAIVFGGIAYADKPVQATFYAAPNGSGDVGSKDAPCSLQGARDLVRKVNQKMTGDIVVYLRGGTYSLTTPFELAESSDVHDSGTNGFNIIYEAYPGETPVISGGLAISNWTLFDKDKSIYRAKVPPGVQSRQFYVNGKRMQRARGPFGPQGWKKTKTGWTIIDTEMQNWRNVSDIEIVSRSSWKQLRCGIASIAGTDVTMKMPGWRNCASSPNLGTPFNGQGTQQMNHVTWVENAFELLTQPGQWYLDQKEGYLYYMATGSEDLSTAVLPVLETILNVYGAGFDNRIHNIEFNGLTFKYATWMQPSGDQGYADNQAGVVWVNVPPTSCKTPGNLSFQYTSDIRFENNAVGHMGGAGIDFGHGPQNDSIEGNCIYDISGNGIFLGEVDDYAATDPKAWCDKNTIKDNYVTHAGAEYEDQVAISTGYTRHLILDHNEVNNLPYSGISVGWGWSKKGYSYQNTITNNFVHDFMKVLEDGGGIYTLGNQGAPDETTEWSGNYITGGKNAQGMYSDEGSGYMNITSNVVTHVADNWMNIWCNWVHDIHVYGNFTNTTKMTNKGTNCVVENNDTTLTDENVPPQAEAIIKNAGLEPAFVSIKNKVPVDPEQMVNDTDPSVVYTGQWSASANRSEGDFDADVHDTKSDGDSASLKFHGRGIDFITECNSDEGPMDVYIDGALVKTVDCASNERRSQQAVYHQLWNTEGDHEIKVQNKSGSYLIVDAFKVYHFPSNK
jgi:hypothetical protein